MDEVEQWLKEFPMECLEYFGRDFNCYNVHSLHHVVEDYRRFGNPEKISAFKFESYNGHHVSKIPNATNKAQPALMIATHTARINKVIPKNAERITMNNPHLYKRCMENTQLLTGYEIIQCDSIGGYKVMRSNMTIPKDDFFLIF